MKLSNATLHELPNSVKVPSYDRSQLTPGIVHIGLGNFHRGHQAWYLHRLMQEGLAHDWAIIGAGVAIFLSKQLADGNISLMAPQANAFATFSVIFAEGQGDLYLLALGFLLGMFVEWATGMGTSFGLGMYLDVPHTLPMLIGGVARDSWEDKRLKPRIDAIKEKEGTTAAEKQRALILLSTFMVAAGLLTGEAFFGTESSILSFVDTLVENPDSMSWYIGRMLGFVGLNVAIGGGIYLLFKRAGVIGGSPATADAVLEN